MLFTKGRDGLFAAANGGTLLLDEIGELPLPLQVKLLRVLQEREVERVGGRKTIQLDVRVLATTNRDLADYVREGKFREDLYYRLNVVPIAVPSLEDRRDDIPRLARHFVEQCHKTQGLPMRDFSEDAVALLQTMVWPGNVRQLKNLVERVLILGEGSDDIEARELPQDGPRDTEEGRVVLSGTLATLPLREAREAFEREYLLFHLTRFGGNISRTAEFVGMDRAALHRKLKGLGVNPPGRASDRSNDEGQDDPADDQATGQTADAG